MLADDPLGLQRETTGPSAFASYEAAFDAIVGDDRNVLVVAEDGQGIVVGCLQLTFIPGLSYRGAERALIEDVRVIASRRGAGIGQRLLKWAMDESRRRGCALVQLLVHESRVDARRFYKNLGFEDQHAGMRRMII